MRSCGGLASTASARCKEHADPETSEHNLACVSRLSLHCWRASAPGSGVEGRGKTRCRRRRRQQSLDTGRRRPVYHMHIRIQASTSSPSSPSFSLLSEKHIGSDTRSLPASRVARRARLLNLSRPQKLGESSPPPRQPSAMVTKFPKAVTFSCYRAIVLSIVSSSSSSNCTLVRTTSVRAAATSAYKPTHT